MKKLPCPRCGKLKRLLVKQMSRMLNPREWEAGWEVQCDNCCMSSGIAQTKEKAVEVWNFLPRLPQWTTETPTESGWYWYRLTNGESLPNMVRLYDVMWDGVLYVHNGVERPIALRDFHAGEIEWAGPIPEPQEAQ